jgi:hypothetical protein
MSKTKIYFNIFISWMFLCLGIYLLFLSKNNTLLYEFPLGIILGLLLLPVNAVLCLRWINILRTY